MNITPQMRKAWRSLRENEVRVLEGKVAKLQQLLLEIYVCGALNMEMEASPDEMERLLNTVLAAGEGRPFEPLDLPFPK